MEMRNENDSIPVFVGKKDLIKYTSPQIRVTTGVTACTSPLEDLNSQKEFNNRIREEILTSGR